MFQRATRATAPYFTISAIGSFAWLATLSGCVDSSSATEAAGGQPGATTAGGATQGLPGQGGATNLPTGVNPQGGATTNPATDTSQGGSPSSGNCGTIHPNPLGCDFAWGAPNENGNSSFADFVSTWVGYEARGGLDGACDGCKVVGDLASSSATVVFYTYFIGYQANLMGGFGDCNVDMSDGHNLCSDGAQWIRSNRALIVEMYGNYAKKTYAASPNKSVIWWLEGDYVQYSYADQTSPLSMAELGSLARDITCAIKSNMPNAIVGMNHSPWISDAQATSFWGAMPMDVLDLVWVQGAGNTGTLVNSGDYNATTANYAWLHGKTGRPIMAETSFAGSGQDDRWSSAGASAINQRINEGVIAVLVNKPSSNYKNAITAMTGLSSVCQ